MKKIHKNTLRSLLSRVAELHNDWVEFVVKNISMEIDMDNPELPPPEPKVKSVKLWAAISDRGTLRWVADPGTDRDTIDLLPDERLVRGVFTFTIPPKKKKK